MLARYTVQDSKYQCLLSAFVMSWFLYPLKKSLIKGVTQRGGDRSAWTDTPEDKERKMMAGEEVRQSSTQYTCTVH